MTLPPDVMSDAISDPTFDPMCHTMASFNPLLTAGLDGTLRGQLWLPPVSTDECSGDIWPSTSQTRIVPFEEYKAAQAAQKRKAAALKPAKPAKPVKPSKAGKKSRSSVLLPKSGKEVELDNPVELAELLEQDALVKEELWRKRETCGSGP